MRMKTRKLLALMVSASMTFNLLGYAAGDIVSADETEEVITEFIYIFNTASEYLTEIFFSYHSLTPCVSCSQFLNISPVSLSLKHTALRWIKLYISLWPSVG